MLAEAPPEKEKVRLIAFYLPQFHPIPENDEWWGKGFTEWTNTAKGRPLFRGHYQPHIPADLGFYDLRVPEIRVAQAELARAYGIEGFCYYHYWFAGRRVLERPFQEVLESGQPDFPFCLCWANDTWSGVWHGEPNRILIEQTYPGPEDHRAHFSALLPAFSDHRYMRVNGKPVFVIYKPDELPEPRKTVELWQRMAVEAGLSGIYFIGTPYPLRWSPIDHGFDAKVQLPYLPIRPWVSRRHIFKWLKQQYNIHSGLPTVHDYETYVKLTSQRELDSDPRCDAYPCLIHAWDNTPRSGKNGVVLDGTDPERFRPFLKAALNAVIGRPATKRLVFLKSWNEWAEGKITLSRISNLVTATCR